MSHDLERSHSAHDDDSSALTTPAPVDPGWGARRVARLTRRMAVTDAGLIVFSVAFGVLAGVTVSPDDVTGLVVVGLIVTAVWLALLSWRQTRATAVLGAGVEEYRRVISVGAMLFLIVATAAYLLDQAPPRRFLLVAVPVGTVLLLLGRMAQRAALARAVSEGYALHRVVVVAPAERARELTEQLQRRTAAGYRVIDVVSPTPSLLEPSLLVARAHEVGADAIVVGLEHIGDADWTRRLGWAMEGQSLTLLLSPSIAEVAGPRLALQPAEGLALIRVFAPRLSGPARVAKRILDLMGSALLLLVLGLPMLVIGLWIRRDSTGPALFKQVRAGIDGTEFVCWKFRTMRVDADNERAALRTSHGDDGATFKMVDDPRITRAGRVLRRTSMDELPQLVNVLRGEMSLVGPRPHPLDDVERYDHHAARRLAVKPGMTGLWQVSGRSDLDWDDGLMLDLYYIENWSLTLDLTLLARTGVAVLRGTGSY